MPELIDREKLKDTISQMVELPNEARVQVLAAVSREKTVDAAPVVRGRWIETEEGATCSECHKHPFEDGEFAIANYNGNYCPNCGADMRGDGDG